MRGCQKNQCAVGVQTEFPAMESMGRHTKFFDVRGLQSKISRDRGTDGDRGFLFVRGNIPRGLQVDAGVGVKGGLQIEQSRFILEEDAVIKVLSSIKDQRTAIS